MSDAKEKIDDPILNDPELVENFKTEAREHLDSIEDDFLNLEKQRDNPDQELLNKVFRAIHSVKGAAGFLGLGNLGRLAHIMETLLSDMRSGKIRPESEYIDALLEGVDLLILMLDDTDHDHEADITRVSERLTNLIDQGAAAGRPIKKRSPKLSADKEKKVVLPATAGAGRGNTVRIQVDILDKLMVQAGELVLVRNQHLLSVDQTDAASRSVAHRLDLVTAELQETIIDTRMQPIGKIIGKFPRMVRELGKNLDKQIQISLSGGEAELDKSILESLTDPLTHIIRNCCSHGIESPKERVRAKKPKTGQISLRAYHEAGRFNIEVRDDGKGIDPELICKKVLEKGLKTAPELDAMSSKEILNLIFLPGFSTADAASNVSGRGVGMDVVKTNIEKLGGSFDIESIVGEGATVYLRLPLTLAIMPALIVASQECLFAIPQAGLVELVGLYDEEVKSKIEYADGLEIYRLRDRLLPLVRLSEVLARPRQFTRETANEITEKYQKKQEKDSMGLVDAAAGPNGVEFTRSLNFVVLRVGDSRYGLIVDRILGIEEIVVKPMHWALKSLGIYSGATIRGDGKVALILDVEGIARHTEIMLNIEMVAEDIDRGMDEESLQTVLLFKSGEKEQFALPLPLIRRIEKISMADIEQVGDREYIAIDKKSTRVLRLDHGLKVSPVVEYESMYLILPRHFNRPVGMLVSGLVDIEETTLELDVESYPEDGLLGTGVIHGTMTLFVDIYRLVEIIEPEWFADRRVDQFDMAEPPPKSGKEILLIEDVSFFRHLVKRYLEAGGYKVTTAENGRVGLERISDSKFDLIVSDLEMPVMNGWEFLKQVRQGRCQKNIPAVALTALETPKDRERAMACGFNRYEVKLDRERVLTTVGELLYSGKQKGPLKNGR